MNTPVASRSPEAWRTPRSPDVDFRVLVRLRPPQPQEGFGGQPVEVRGREVSVRGDDTLNTKESSAYTYIFDHVFDRDTEQEALYQTVAQPAVESTLLGFNASIIAYGQTGAGSPNPYPSPSPSPRPALATPCPYALVVARWLPLCTCHCAPAPPLHLQARRTRCRARRRSLGSSRARSERASRR